jgi:putative nucleotidyltransferase with HDIG domain
MALYRDGHPTRARAAETAYQRLVELQNEDPTPEITMLDGDIIYRGRPLRELKKWEWAGRLESAGVQRIEIIGPVSMDEFDGFLDDTMRLLLDGSLPTAEVRQARRSNIRFGAVGLDDAPLAVAEETASEPAEEKEASPDLAFALQEEADTIEWLHEELKEKGSLRLLEAEAIIRSLSVAMHGDQDLLVPLVRMKRFDQYTTTHALNVSVLSMALAEWFALPAGDVRVFGIAGLLHDLGKVKVPEEILNKAGKLTPQERTIINRHPSEGARIILETEFSLDLAAVVAYEHHIRIDGGGYPALTYPRICHQASNMVHVCDVYDALRTRRPYREAWPQKKVLAYIYQGAGKEFDHDLALGFVRMMQKWDSRIADLHRADQAIPLGAYSSKGAVGGSGTVASERGAGTASTGAANVPAPPSQDHRGAGPTPRASPGPRPDGAPAPPGSASKPSERP